MPKITQLRTVVVRHYNHIWDKVEKVPLTGNVRGDKYWKDCGLIGAIVKTGETFELKRQSKTVVKKFAGFIDEPIALDVWVDFDTGGIGKVTIYVDPSVDSGWAQRLSGKLSGPNSAHVIAAEINFQESP